MLSSDLIVPANVTHGSVCSAAVKCWPWSWWCYNRRLASCRRSWSRPRIEHCLCGAARCCMWSNQKNFFFFTQPKTCFLLQKPQYQPMPVSYPPQMYSPTPPQQQYAPIPQTPVWSPDVWSPEPYKPGPAQSYQLYPHQQQPQAIYTHAYMPAAAAMHHPHMPYAAVTTTSPQLGYVTRTVSQWLQQIGYRGKRPIKIL